MTEPNAIRAIKQFEQAITVALATVDADPNLSRRAKAAKLLVERCRTASGQFGDARTDAISEAVDDGWSYSDIATEFDISRPRAHQIVHREENRAANKRYRESRRVT